jgi:UPF0755 protein
MRVLKLFVALVLAGLAVAAAGLGWGYLQLTRPVGSDASLVVGRGDTLKPILERLAQQGVLPHPRGLYLYARLTGAAEVRTGDYDIDTSHSSLDVLRMLGQGRVRMETFTLPEGYNRWQVRDFLVEHRWLAAAEFEALCDDEGFLAQHGVPGPTCDGYLFPETYTFARGIAAKVLLAEMFATFHRVHAEVTAQGRGPMNLGKREFATLASIVEKETGAPEERPRIACVFYNRLTAKDRWRLDTDPTVIYAAKLADPGFDGNLKRSHLRQLDSPYNTYRNIGLPPGPIANAGRAALEAVAEPADCQDFFFVSMNNGRHEFCPTLDCHNRAVEKWQVQYFKRRP